MATILTRAGLGIESPLVTVEVHTGGGLPAFAIVGLPEAAVRESRERVRASLQTCGYRFPDGKVIVNLAPADLPKEGGRYDLPIALGLLIASRQLDGISAGTLEIHEFVGELALDGRLRPVRGVLPASAAAAELGHALVVPKPTGPEAALAHGSRVLVAEHLSEVVEHLKGLGELARCEACLVPRPV